jgi:predicted transcriptional regulator YheO
MSPLGMSGQSQSIQDIFTNAKLSQQEKSVSVLLRSDDKIAAILCWKTAHDLAIDDTTQRIWMIRCGVIS